MKVLGKYNYFKQGTNTLVTYLYVSTPFATYQSDTEKGRYCEGVAVDVLYAGEIDCTDVKVGSTIEVYYGKAYTTKDGKTIQPICKIEVVD